MGRGSFGASREGSHANQSSDGGRHWLRRGVAPEKATFATTLRAHLNERQLILVSTGLTAVLLPLVLRSRPERMPTLRAALETMLASFTIAASALLLHQYARHRRLPDLVLAGAASTMALLNLAVIAVPTVLALPRGGHVVAAGLWGTLFVACSLLAAAWVPRQHLVTELRHPIQTAVGVSIALVTVAELAGRGIGVPLADATGRSVASSAVGLGTMLRPLLAGAAITALLIAAAGFLRQPRDRGTKFRNSLAAAAILLAGASFSNLLVHAAPGQLPQSAILRTLAVAVILGAALRREIGARQAGSRAVALAERRRVARDLHDGLAQDLALIVAHAPRMADDLGHEHPVVVAARHALDISRGTISELSDPAGASTRESIEAVAEELRQRFQVEIVVDTDLEDEPPRATRETVTRITREAIANAARHGDARHIVVSVQGDDGGVALRVIDDGRGGAGSSAPTFTEGFGLGSMRERASALGGCLSIAPARWGGTELEVRLP